MGQDEVVPLSLGIGTDYHLSRLGGCPNPVPLEPQGFFYVLGQLDKK